MLSVLFVSRGREETVAASVVAVVELVIIVVLVVVVVVIVVPGVIGVVVLEAHLRVRVRVTT